MVLGSDISKKTEKWSGYSRFMYVEIRVLGAGWRGGSAGTRRAQERGIGGSRRWEEIGEVV
jgi:hypothetical protein